MRNHSRLLSLGLVAVSIMVTSRQAAAHAILLEGTPAPNSVVTGPSIPLKLRFNGRIDASRSRLVLTLPDGSSRELKIHQQQPPDILAAEADKLPPGSYRLHWLVLAADGHITQGEIPFSVRNP